jgi:hypothetical protein
MGLVVGDGDGRYVGGQLGGADGLAVGDADGRKLGTGLGRAEGPVGALVGLMEGDGEWIAAHGQQVF